jgi:cytochrome c oxidase subunit 2
MLRYNRKAKPTPSETTHNVPLEIIWTIIPIGILVVIAIPSFQLLFYQHKMPAFDMSLKVTGYQWYWGYEYPDHGDINFLSYMIPDDQIDESKGQKRLLETDNPIVLPVGKNVELLITAADVLHSWTVPSLGVKRDAVPGRLNQTWVRIDKPGIYYGQCSEICGTGHAYMPIMIKAVTPEEFDAWVETAKEEFAMAPLGQTSNIETAAVTQ